MILESTHFYDNDNGALVKLKEPDGAMLQFANTADGLRYLKTDGLGYDTQYSYQADRSISAAASSNFGRVSREIDALNHSADTDYGLYDQPTTTTDKRGNPVTRIYYATTDAATFAVAGKVSELRATVAGTPNVLLASFTYHASGAAFGQLKQKIEYIDPANPARKRLTDYVYELNGLNLQSLTVSGATGGGSMTKSFTYDSLGRLQTQTLQRRTSATNPALVNLTTTYTYDSLGRVTRVTTPRGDIQETVYDANGQVTQEKVHYLTGTARPHCAAPSGGYVVCTYATHGYDAADRRVSTTDILGHTTRFAYDANGNLIRQTDANGHGTHYEYDPMNRRSAVIDANGHRSEMTYDPGGRLIATKDANGRVTKHEYDALGRQTKLITALGHETQTQYDANGNVTHVTDANAAAGLQPTNDQAASVYRQYDELGRLTLERDALNGDTVYRHDLLGNLTSITDAAGQVTGFVYDDLGRLTETRDPVIEAGTDKTDKVLLYDQAGNVLLTEDRTGRQRRHSYDTLNRRSATEYLSDGSYDSYAYDAFGDLTQIANEGVSYTYTYTPRHQLASKTDSRLSKTLSWTYDPVGNVQTKTDYQGEVTEFQYDSTNRLVAQKNGAYLQVSYHYDGAGRLLNRILSNGAQTDYRYDTDNRLTGLRNKSASGSVVEDLTYTRDRVGNITSSTDAVSGRSVAYTYDALYRLTNVDSSTHSDDRAYTYDAVGNRRTETANGMTYHYCYHATDCSAAPSGNRLINIRTGSLTGPLWRQFSYDDAGRVLQKENGAGAPIYIASYNGKGRASQISGHQTNTFAYDPNDYRIQKDSKLYHLEGEHLEATCGSTGQLQNTYLRGVVVDEIVNGYTYHSSDPNDRTNTTFHHDHLNSVTALTGHAGSTEETTKYDAFGAPLNLTIPGTGNDLLYTGREYDRGTGLYYYRARYYDPEIGRFISEDPLGFQAGINFYAYVGNNPVNANDPTGLLDVIYNVGVPGTRIENSPVTGINNYVEASHGRYPIADNNIPNDNLSVLMMGFNDVWSEPQTTQWIADAVGQNMSVGNVNVYNPFPWGDVTQYSKEGGLWDRKHSLDMGSLYVVDGAAQYRDYIGNMQWAATMKLQGSPEAWTKTGANVQALWATHQLDDPRDQSAISAGYNINLNWSPLSSSANGGFVLYPSKPNTNQMQAVYAK